MDWKSTNTLSSPDLLAVIRKGKMKCAAAGCKRIATDRHHIDHNHSNNNPSNLAPACKLCHDKEHGITAEINELKLLTRQFYTIQDQRKALASRIGAYKRLELPTEHVEKAFEDVKETEAKLKHYIEEMLRTNSFYNAWLKHVKGIGPLLSASIITEIGSPERFNTVGQLISYAGENVIRGKARRREKGNKANWNGQLKMTLYKIASSFIKYDCFGRRLYDEYKQYYIDRDGAEPKHKAHNRALRRVGKDFLRCTYLAWLEHIGKPMNRARPETKVFPDNWIE